MKRNSRRFNSIEEALSFYEVKNECHLFLGSTTKESFGKGYGFFTLNGNRYATHRLAYELAYGPIPKKLYICHKCNIKNCINPEHLYAGTAKQNSADRTNDLKEKNKKPLFIKPDILKNVSSLIEEVYPQSKKITLFLPISLYENLKLMSFLTHKTMSDFIRISISLKINELKKKKEENKPSQKK